MNEYLNNLVKTYSKRGILIDTNILILLLVGEFDRKLITDFKRLNTFSEEDYDILVLFLRNFKEFYFTPNIITEITNLTDSINKQPDFLFFQHINLILSKFQEEYIPAVDTFRSKSFNKFGSTDSVNVILSNKYLILTDDLRLYSFLENTGLPAINFNHLRNL